MPAIFKPSVGMTFSQLHRGCFFRFPNADKVGMLLRSFRVSAHDIFQKLVPAGGYDDIYAVCLSAGDFHGAVFIANTHFLGHLVVQEVIPVLVNSENNIVFMDASSHPIHTQETGLEEQNA